MRHIGVDLHKTSFVACFLEEDDGHHFATYSVTVEGLAAFRAELKPEDQVAVEVGTNAYYFYDHVASAVAEVVLVSTYQFAVIAKSTKKTDRNDALALARFLKLGCLPTVTMPNARIRELRHLFTARDALVKMGRQLRNMGHAVLARNGIAASRGAFASHLGRERLARRDDLAPVDRQILDLVLRQIETLETELDELERAIVRTGRQLPGLKRLLQVRGLGLIAAIGVLTEIGDIHQFSSAKHLVSYAGLGVVVRQSGATDRRGHITKHGRQRLRGFMVEAVLSMLRDPAENALADFYHRKKKDKGAGKAICATARKLLTIVWVLLTKERDYKFLEERLYERKLRQLARAA